MEERKRYSIGSYRATGVINTEVYSETGFIFREINPALIILQNNLLTNLKSFRLPAEGIKGFTYGRQYI